MEPIVGISSLHFNWTNLEEAFKRCKLEFGLKVIEFSYPDLLKDNNLSYVKKINEKYELKLGLHIWDNLPELGKINSILKLKDYLKICLITGIDFITMHLGKYDEKEKGLKIVFEVLKEIVPLYEKEKIQICIENHYIDELGNCPEEFLYFFEKIDSTSLKFCFDYGHGNLTGNIFDFIEKLHKFFGIAHISDNNGEKDEHLYYKDGNIKWEELIPLTLKKGFYGPYIIEYGGKKEKFNKIEEFKNDLKYLVENL
ncbi:MAG: sugar phosphate isomerase/epimerase family protein [Candidatus Ratteibacteria bacterium]